MVDAVRRFDSGVHESVAVQDDVGADAQRGKFAFGVGRRDREPVLVQGTVNAVRNAVEDGVYAVGFLRQLERIIAREIFADEISRCREAVVIIGLVAASDRYDIASRRLSKQRAGEFVCQVPGEQVGFIVYLACLASGVRNRLPSCGPAGRVPGRRPDAYRRTGD